MPCYDRCRTFYYYDVLEALSRNLFQQIIDSKKEKLEKELGLDDAYSTHSHSVEEENSEGAGGKSDVEKQEKKEGEDKKELTVREQEEQDDILNGNLEEILRKLEEKGGENKEIERYKEMRNWRVKRDKVVRNHLEQFDEKNGSNRKSIIDSSQLIGARTILKYMRKNKALKESGSKDRKSPEIENPEYIAAKRQAKILEKEITRK